MLAAHDGPETGEDGPTHHGLFWMSLYTAYPGIKVYKPLDANEAIEMLFHGGAARRAGGVLGTRPGTPVLKRGDGVPPAREAINGAYVFKPFRENGKPKKVLAISGGQVMANAARDPAGDRGAARRQDCRRHFAAALRGTEAHRSGQGRGKFSPTTSGNTSWRCTTDGPASCIRSCCRRIIEAAFSAWTTSPGPGKPDEIYRHAGFDTEGLARRSSTARNSNRTFEGRLAASPTSGAGTNRRP